LFGHALARFSDLAEADLIPCFLRFGLGDPPGDGSGACPGVEWDAVLGQLPVAFGDLARRFRLTLAGE
jgi:hypothetical protein